MSGADRIIRVAAAQYPLDELDSLQVWQDKLDRWVREGALTGAQLLVFPEYGAIEQAAPMGADVCGDLGVTLDAVAEAAGERVAFHCELAKDHGVYILAGSGPVRSAGGVFHNAAQLVSPAGQVGEQRKMIMTPFEKNWGVSGGDHLCVFDTEFGRVGVAICYDSEFPILVKGLSALGVELLLVPSCTEKISGFHRVRTGARARALENQFAAVTSPTIGLAEWSPAVDINTGAAGVYVPPEHGVSDDGILAEGEINAPGWIVADIDLARLRALRTDGEMRNFVDWHAQPGVGGPGMMEIVDLRGG